MVERDPITLPPALTQSTPQPASPPSLSARSLAFQALRAVHGGAYADVALDRTLKTATLQGSDRRLATELVYGCVRRQRTLDALIDTFAQKPAAQQPPDLRTLFHLGLYQLRYLDHIPPSAAVNTTVDLAKAHGLKGLAGVVNGLLRQYIRRCAPLESGHPPADPLVLPADLQQHLGLLHSYPDWIVDVWRSQLPESELEALAQWFNAPPSLDLRVNPLQSNRDQVQQRLIDQQLSVQPIPHLPQGLRVTGATGAIQALPGFAEGWWMVQDASAQLVTHLLDPQPGETIIDACAAPGGKTAHIAERMENRGVIWALDRTASRLRKLKQNAKRLGLKNIRIQEGDSRDQPQFAHRGDRVLVDAPCSGLGTLHRHADARWRQTPEGIDELAQLQRALLSAAATWVKPHGLLVYSTCTLHPSENEAVIQQFLQAHPRWQIEPPPPSSPAGPHVAPEGWVKIWPHRAQMDGFFMVGLRSP